MNSKNTFSGIVDKTYKDFIDSLKTVKNCETCIHNRGGINCGLKDKYNDYKSEMKGLIDKWGEDNGFGFSLDCPSWYKEPNSKQTECYTSSFSDDDEKRPCNDTTARGKRSELPIHYHDYGKCENKEELFEMVMKGLFG